MNNLGDLLREEEQRLKQILDQVEKELAVAPDGKLRICKGRKTPQYYQCIEGVTNGNGTYISIKNEKLIRGLAQKRYDEKLISMVENRLNLVTKLAKEYQKGEIEDIYLKESLERRKLICPIEPIWDDMVKIWEQQEYSGKGFLEGSPEIYSEKGERVRSKTERNIADYFYRNNIAYRYEMPLVLPGYGTVYPDFTIPSRKKRKIVYWEHLGMMDNPEYARKVVKKMKLYEKHGIIPGDNLILTYETSQTILNTKDIEMLVERFII